MNDLKKIKYIQMSDLIGVFIFLVLLIPSLILRGLNKILKREIWLVTELKDTCRDNGYHFFKYVRNNYPNCRCYYAIDTSCNDYQKIKDLGNIIEFGGLKYWLYYMVANKNIITNKATDPSHLIFYVLHKYLNLYNNCVFLQHGIIKDDAPMFYYTNAKFKLFICGAQPEYEFVKNKFGYPADNVKYTGLARFDNLHNVNVRTNQILIMPTWRNWLGRDINMLAGTLQSFKESDYYKCWNGLLNNEQFIQYIEKNNMVVKFYPHYQMQRYINDFNTISDNIRIVTNDEEDIQILLKESALLITDYSSVYMDFAYMEKPMIYYQFDFEEYREKQLQPGYFDYKKDGFGDVCYSAEEVLKSIVKFNKNYTPTQLYLERMEQFFVIRDNNNCERIYQEIKKIS